MKRSPDISATLAKAARDVQRAVWIAGPAEPLGVAQLREDGWQLTQLTAGLADLAAVLADHTGHHAADPADVRDVDGGDPRPDLGRACQALTRLRQATTAAQAAARDYYAAISHLAPAPHDSALTRP